ncbi:MAG: S-layer homology domain-containing protein, partial [Eubacteriales bacterium]
RYFYSYINMLYPQVKAVCYFNTNFDGNQYCLFGEDANDAVAAVYQKTLSANAVMSARPVGTGYTRLSTLHETRTAGDTGLYLAVYAAYPGNPKMTVTYTLDGKQAAKTSVVPYAASLPASLLGAGRHTLTVRTEVGASVYSEDYVIYVSSDGTVRAGKPDLTDVPETGWAYPYVSYCVAEGFFDGLVSSAFRPTEPVSRGMFVTLLGRAVGIDASAYGASDFSDVKKNAYYSSYVTWAKEAGVTAGTSDTLFSPDMIVTREQICAMLVRYCDNAGIHIPESSGNRLFADDAQIADYFRDAVYRARAAGMINGKDGNRFDPKAQLTRQEISVILKNFHEQFVRAAEDGSAQ